MKKKDIAILCQFFYPEYITSSILSVDVALELINGGFSVGALTGYPKEYTKEKKVKKRESYCDIDIKRVKYIQVKRSGSLGRIINHISLFISTLFSVGFLKDYSTVVVYSSPPIFPLIAVIAKKLYKCKLVFVSYDVYPEIAINTGNASKRGLMTRVFNFVNKKTFKNADKVVALSEDMKKFLVENRKISEDKVAIIPNWCDDLLSENAKSADNDISAKFTVSYLGNLGICQDETTIFGAIEKMTKENDVKFLFAGHGSKMGLLKQKKSDNEWESVEIHDYLQGEEYEKVLKQSDCFIVSLVGGLNGLCSPSKTINYLMCGKPVICIMDRETELAIDIDKGNAGKVFEVGDIDGVAEFINELKNDRKKHAEMSQNARALFLRKYTKERCTQQYIDLLNNTVG